MDEPITQGEGSSYSSKKVSTVTTGSVETGTAIDPNNPRKEELLGGRTPSPGDNRKEESHSMKSMHQNRANDDDLTIIDKLVQLDMLREQLERSMSDGFAQLARANFHNRDAISIRYGRDYWNENYEGCWSVDVNETGVSLNRSNGVDPLRFFAGGINVPSSLRSSQSKFRSAMELVAPLVNCQNDLNKYCT